MKKPRFLSRLILPLIATFVVFFGNLPVYAANAQSEWVHPGTDGKLAYKTTPPGDKIMDFSYAGYMGGGVAIPDVPVKVKVESGNTTAIQQAIDQVAAMPIENGFRGAVLLAPGIYNLNAPLRLSVSGVVLRGSGSGEDGTVLKLGGRAGSAASLGGRGGRGGNRPDDSVAPQFVAIADAYVPSGAMSFNVADASGFKAGDAIRIVRPVTEKWVALMGMDKLVRNGKKQTWINGEVATDRFIAAVDGNKITLDVPLTDSYDSKYLSPPGVRVVKREAGSPVSQVGIENLRIVSPPQNVSMGAARFHGFSIGNVVDAWARDIKLVDTANSVSVSGRRITLERIDIQHTVATLGAAKPADFGCSGSQVLYDRCTVQCDNVFFFGTMGGVAGPNVLLNCTFKGNGWIQPHMRWATGLLVDNCEVPNGGIDFMNRGEMGSGHGWAIAWAVAWNCRAQSYLNQLPPGAANWVIGRTGEHQKRAVPFDKEPLLAEGIYDSPGMPVAPKSLYLAQLQERLGQQAVKNIGY